MKANKLALATILVASASCPMPGENVIKVIADQCGLDKSSVKSIADEIMAAKAVAESDMYNTSFTNSIPERSGSEIYD